MSRVTIRDIAKMAGVSPSAVSFVINDKPGVSEETRKLVKNIIKKTGFVPNISSRRLVFKRSFNIALVMNDENSPMEDLFYVGIMRGLLKRSKDYGYNIVFTEIDIKNDEVRLPRLIRQHDTDGVIFLQDCAPAITSAIKSLDIPYVIVDAQEDNPQNISININYELAALTSTSYLIENGHRKIAFISKGSVPNFYMQTFKGFCRALDKYNISIPPYWIQITATNESDAYGCMKSILESKSTPTAVFCAVDSFAIGAIKCAYDKGYKIPDDISFTGIDNLFLSEYLTPSLTTININKEQLGSLATDLIVKMIEKEEVTSVHVRSDELIIRNSVMKI